MAKNAAAARDRFRATRPHLALTAHFRRLQPTFKANLPVN